MGIPNSWYSVGEIQRFVNSRLFSAFQPTNQLNLLKLGSVSPLPDKSKTLVGRVGLHERRGRGREGGEQNEVSSECNESKSGAEWRNWAEIPRDILLIIFKKVAVAEILSSAQFVCKPWRRLSLDPELWRCIDLRMYDRLDDMVAIVMMAVDRSEGCLEELYIGYFSTDELMHYITERATRLRGLHIISVGLYEETLVKTLRKLPLLEELEISRCYCFSYNVLERVGAACPQLKSFRLDYRVPTYPLYTRSDSRKNVDALAIAEHFKQLRRLRLFSNCLTNVGLLAILDNCPYLEYLDIRYCFNVDFLDERDRKSVV